MGFSPEVVLHEYDDAHGPRSDARSGTDGVDAKWDLAVEPLAGLLSMDNLQPPIAN